MGRVVELPPELWLMTFDFAVEAQIDPVDHCTYLTFPEINDHLRHPFKFPSSMHSFLRNLRLVCRAFKHLLKLSPYFFMWDLSRKVPINMRALYIKPTRKAEMYLKHALSEPSKCRRIVLLNLLGARSTPRPISFDCLYDNAQFLPELRGLSLRVRTPDTENVVTPRFWNRLHESFPLLTSLVLWGLLYTTDPDPAITFEKLEILEWVDFKPHSNLRFPAVRYLALGIISPFGMRSFIPWSHLESLLLRQILHGFQVPWHLLPNLRMLGIPQVNGCNPLAVTRLPGGHPLQHLHVYVDSKLRRSRIQTISRYEMELAWLKEITKKLPTVTQIVLCFTGRSQLKTPIIEGDFKDEDLRLLNLIDNDPSAQRSDRVRVTLNEVRSVGLKD